jgi:hypothetical protein
MGVELKRKTMVMRWMLRARNNAKVRHCAGGDAVRVLPWQRVLLFSDSLVSITTVCDVHHICHVT